MIFCCCNTIVISVIRQLTVAQEELLNRQRMMDGMPITINKNHHHQVTEMMRMDGYNKDCWC